jgi:hypothetical protein
MPKYAQFDPQITPAPVCGWYDTDEFDYANLPPQREMLEMSEEQWSLRLDGLWAVQVGVLVPYTRPPPVLSLAQSSVVAMAEGLTVSLTGSASLQPTLFPIDPLTQAKLAAVATIINTTGGFPGGAGEYPIKDSAGEWHVFTLNEYKAVAGAIATYVAALDLIIDGNPLNATGLPANSVALEL